MLVEIFLPYLGGSPFIECTILVIQMVLIDRLEVRHHGLLSFFAQKI